MSLEGTTDTGPNSAVPLEKVPKAIPRLQTLPPELQKVSAGSISLNHSEVSQPQISVPQTDVFTNSSENLISESQRILASLANFQENPPPPEKKEETAFTKEELSPPPLENSTKTSVVISDLKNLDRARRALAVWLGEREQIEIPVSEIAKLLLRQSEVAGVAVVDQEGLILTLESRLKLNHKVLANLAIRLFSQTRFAAEEIETSFHNQVVIGFQTVTLQIAYHRGFYLVAFFEKLPSSQILRRLRKVVKALARVESGG